MRQLIHHNNMKKLIALLALLAPVSVLAQSVTLDSEWDTQAEVETAWGIEIAAGNGTAHGDLFVWDNTALTWEIHPMTGDATINQNGVITITNPISLLDPNADVPLYYNNTNERIESSRGVINYSETVVIYEPDAVRGLSDDMILKKFIAEEFPNGVTITSIHIDASSAYTSETFLFEHWDDASGTTQASVESIAASAISTEDDGTFTDATIPADYFLVLNFDDTPEDIIYVAITFSYTID